MYGYSDRTVWWRALEIRKEFRSYSSRARIAFNMSRTMPRPQSVG